MPLLDHFHPPLSLRRHWQAFHSAWAAALARQLNEALLPARYFAEPNVQVGGQVEIDIATFEEETGSRSVDGYPGGGIATAVWAPARPALSLPVDFGSLSVFEVRISYDEEGPTVVAAIELVSPANKDRPAHRKAFVTKCASYLHEGISVAVVDAVTSRQGSLHSELLEFLQLAGGKSERSSSLTAAAYRTAPRSGDLYLEAWVEPLALGSPLPVLPLWLSADLAVPLDLEQTYASTCSALRIPT